MLVWDTGGTKTVWKVVDMENILKGGRLSLIQSTLFILSIYVMSLFSIPRKVT